MRIDRAAGHGEIRNSLARDWGRFFEKVFPDAYWLPVPNLGPRSSAYAENWGLNAFILSGGNDIGEEPLRDRSEVSLLEFSQERGFPLIGVCRGMQMVVTHLGGEVVACRGISHRATRHRVSLQNVFWNHEGKSSLMVNSFHNQCVRAIGDEFMPLAVDDDGCFEACYSHDRNILAVMWHPERYGRIRKLDRLLFQNWFGKTA